MRNVRSIAEGTNSSTVGPIHEEKNDRLVQVTTCYDLTLVYFKTRAAAPGEVVSIENKCINTSENNYPDSEYRDRVILSFFQNLFLLPVYS